MTWPINFRLLNPWIHPDDFMTAVHAQLDESRRNRLPRIPENVIVEDFFIANLVETWPPNQQQKETLIELLSDKKFCERLASALATGKAPTWDKISRLILENWRELRLKPTFEAKHRKLPGLQDWSPRAIEGLFSHAGILDSDYKGNFEDWFTKRRQRLGLRGKNRYLIENFIAIDDTTRIVPRGRTWKSFLRPGK